MKFYGFYISKKNERLRNKIIESGVLPFEELIKGKAEKTYIEMLDDLENQPVFLFSGFADEKMKHSPFAKLFSEDEYNLELNVSIFKSYAKGVIQRVDPITKNILIKWDIDYQSVTWYRFTFSDPIWALDTNKNAKHEQLYKIVFENQPMDYEWWAQNGDWKQKLRNQKKALTEDMEKLFKNWLGSQITQRGNLFSDSPDQINNLSRDLRETIPSWPAVNIENVFFETDLSVINNLYERCRNNGDLQILSESIGNHRPRNALGQYFKFLKNYLANDSKEQIELEDNKGKSMTNVLNQILYGPPGTGKTYSTVKQAMQILAPEMDESLYPESIQALKDQYAGQIEFVTFHQSFSYEDFVEGIRAIPPGEDGNDSEQMIYKTVSGIFKKICSEAINKEYVFEDNSELIDNRKTVWKISLGGAREHAIKTTCFANSEMRIGWVGVNNSNNSDAAFSELSAKTKSTLTAFEEEMEVGDLVVSLYDSKSIDGIGVINGEFERDSDPEYPRKRAVKWLWHTIKDSKPINIYELNNVNMVQQTVYRLNRLKPSDIFELLPKDSLLPKVESDSQKKNFVLIIDEINRGNISRIFGELITLIEDSKRLGNAEAISVQLPYSKESFSVPNNLYIIGTMNTADRSLAMMDTALRRRFDFIEMMPNPVFLNKKYKELKFDEKNNEKWFKNEDLEDDLIIYDINIRRILLVINTRIEALYDREHTIGHAFFMSLHESPTINDLANIFKNKVLPLLEEYFYDDWQKIRLVLGASAEEFYKKVTIDENLFSQADETPNFSKVRFEKQDVENLDSRVFIRIYDSSHDEQPKTSAKEESQALENTENVE